MLPQEIFLEEVNKYKTIVFFGIGKRFRLFEKTFPQKNIKDKLLFCVDNNSELHGTKVKYMDKEVAVYSIESLKSVNIQETLVIITCYNYLPIQEQLTSDILLKDIHICSFTPLYGEILEREALEKELPSNIKLSKTSLIPKVIHYCWFGKKPLPDKNKRWMESWIKFCPDYEIKLWNEDNYDITKIPYMKEAYEKKKWGFVPDYARLDIVYQYGGLYFDTDVELIGNIDDLLYEEAFICFESRKVNLGSGFGAQKEMPMIKAMMEDYRDRHFIKEDGTLDMTSSNTIHSQLLEKMGLKMNGEYQIINGLTVLPEKVLCGKHDTTRRIKLKPYTRAIHHFDGSWLESTITDYVEYVEKK